MNYFRQTNKQALFRWAILISVALLSAQGVRLHVHALVHNHVENQQHGALTATVFTKHEHQSVAHLSSDTSHSDHHDDLASELDASPYGLLKKVSNSVLALALFFVTVIFLLTEFYRQVIHHRHDEYTILTWRYHFSPPLRAPPL